MKLIETVQQLTIDDYINAIIVKKNILITSIMVFISIIFSTVIIYFLLPILHITIYNLYLLLGIIVVAILLLFFLIPMVKYQIKKKLRQIVVIDNSLLQPTIVTLYDDKVEFKTYGELTPNIYYNMTYSAFHIINETKDNFALIISNDEYKIINKRNLEENQILLIRNLLKDKCEKCYLLKK